MSMNDKLFFENKIIKKKYLNEKKKKTKKNKIFCQMEMAPNHLDISAQKH